LDRVVFLDIDGVLLTHRVWAMAVNTHVLEMRRTTLQGREARWGWMDAVAFDPCAVGLVNRLCDVTDARIVVSSNWRLTYRGEMETVQKLIAQGIRRELFHDDAWVPSRFRRDRKAASVQDWLEGHGGAGSVAHICLSGSSHDGGGWRLPNVIECSADDGISMKAYREAVRALGGPDAEAGC
jgi:hypothetical protein